MLMLKLRLLVAVCSVSSCLFLTSGAGAAENRSFTGSWSASGSQETLALGPERNAALFKLAGHIHLQRDTGDSGYYWSECVGLFDSGEGSHIRCVWRSPEGQEVYLALKTGDLTEGREVTGEFIGGTGSFSGITGSLSFHWSTMTTQSTNKVTSIGGYSNDLKGSYTLP